MADPNNQGPVSWADLLKQFGAAQGGAGFGGAGANGGDSDGPAGGPRRGGHRPGGNEFSAFRDALSQMSKKALMKHLNDLSKTVKRCIACHRRVQPFLVPQPKGTA